jgi:hypothetical protein
MYIIMMVSRCVPGIANFVSCSDSTFLSHIARYLVVSNSYQNVFSRNNPKVSHANINMSYK